MEENPDLLKTIDYSTIKRSKLGLKETEIMKDVINFLESNSLKTIKTPLKGTCFQITKDELKIVFSSRSTSDSGSYGAASKESRLAVVDLQSEEVVLDRRVSEKDISTIALSNDDRYVYAGGAECIVYKFNIADLTRISVYSGHTGDVTSIFITLDDAWMLTSSNDGTLRIWPLDLSSQSEILIQIKSEINSMDLNFDNQYVAIGGNDSTLYLYQLSLNDRRVLKEITNENPISSCKISKKSTYVVLGDIVGNVKVVKFSSWEISHSFSMNKRISTIDISTNSEIIIVGSENTNIKVFFIKTNQEIDFNGHTGRVKKCCLMKNDSKVVSISEDRSLKIWKMPEPENESKFFNDKDIIINKIWITSSGEGINGIISRNCQLFAMVWDFNGQVKQDFLISHIEFPIYNVNDNHDYILCANPASLESNIDSYNKVFTLDLFSLKIGKIVKSSKIQKEIQSVYIPSTLKYFIVGVIFKILIFDSDIFTILKAVYFPGENMVEVLSNKKDESLFVVGSSQLVYYHFNLEAESSLFQVVDVKNYEETFFSASLHYTDSTQYLYFLNSSMFEVIHTPSFLVVCKINQPFSGFFKNINETIFLYSETIIKIISNETFQELASIRKDYKISSIVLSKDFDFIYICTLGKIIRCENPLNPSKNTLIGDYSRLEEFQVFIDTLFDKTQDVLQVSSGWLIEPAHVNLLHVYAYLNMYNLLNDSVSGKAGIFIPLIISRHGFSPLTIASKMNFIECIHSIVKSLIKKVKKSAQDDIIPMLMFKTIEDDLISLNLSGYKLLHKIYKYIYMIDKTSYLPNCCSATIKLPIFHSTKEYYINPKEFGLEDEEEGFKMRSVIFKKSLVRMNLEMGSKKSLEFMSSLTGCNNFEVFQTEFISIILKQKWKKVRWIFYFQTFLYLVYLILLSLYNSHNESRRKIFLLAPFMISQILYIYEIIFIVIEGLHYFKDPWNIVDTFRSIIMTSYSILVWADYFDISRDKNEKERYMMAVLITLSWVRGITYFRIIKSTRYLVKLLFQVFIDIFPFLAILFYSTLAFSLILRSFISDKDAIFFDNLTKTYMILIGEWDYPNEANFNSLILFFATLLNTVISLNLLISILTNTFNKVKDNQIVADSQELNQMIVEAEKLIFWKREFDDKFYLHAIEKDTDLNDDTNKLDILIKKLKSKVARVDVGLESYDEAIENLRDKLKIYNAEIQESLNGYFFY